MDDKNIINIIEYKKNGKDFINRVWLRAHPMNISGVVAHEEDGTAYIILIKTDEKSFTKPNKDIILDALNNFKIVGIIVPKVTDSQYDNLETRKMLYLTSIIDPTIDFEFFSTKDKYYFILGKRYLLTNDYLVISRNSCLCCKSLKNMDANDTINTLIIGAPIYNKNYKICGLFVAGHYEPRTNEYSIAFLEKRLFIPQKNLHIYSDVFFFTKLNK